MSDALSTLWWLISGFFGTIFGLPLIGGILQIVFLGVVLYAAYKFKPTHAVMIYLWQRVLPYLGRYMPRVQWPWENGSGVGPARVEYRERIVTARRSFKRFLVSRIAWMALGGGVALAVEHWAIVGPYLRSLF